MIKYTADVKILLRASGMSDVDILQAEIQGNRDLLRIVAAMFPRPIRPDERELKRLEAQVGSEVLALMGLKCAPGKHH
jgi:hypothetical protein